MGNNSRYNLTWEGKCEIPHKKCSHEAPPKANFCPTCGQRIGTLNLNQVMALEIESNEEMSYCLQPDGNSEERGKWYEHEADLRALSKKYSGVLFTLTVYGEDGSNSRKYFRDGKMQAVRPEFPVFCSSLLR